MKKVVTFACVLTMIIWLATGTFAGLSSQAMCTDPGDGSDCSTVGSGLYENNTNLEIDLGAGDQLQSDAEAAIDQIAPADIIIDNTSSSFYASASWGTATGPGMWGTDCRYRFTAATSDSARWTPNIPTAGNWTVYAWWAAGFNRHPNSAYIVRHAGGDATIMVNQQINGSKWNALGSFNLGTGTWYPVQKSCWATTGFIVIADAIKWHKN